MAKGKLLAVKIDVTKIDKSKLYRGKKGTYLNLDVWLNDEPDKYGRDGSVSMTQTRDERDANEPKVYLGDAKKLYGWRDDPSRSHGHDDDYGNDEVGDDDVPF